MNATDLLANFIQRARGKNGGVRTDGGYDSILVSQRQGDYLHNLCDREGITHPDSGRGGIEQFEFGGTGYTTMRLLKCGAYQLRIPSDSPLGSTPKTGLVVRNGRQQVMGNGNGQRKEQVAVTAGVFRKDGHVYVVKPNREKNRVYAKEIVPTAPRMTEAGEVVDFETIYKPGVVYDLEESDRWAWAEASALLTKYARCIVCGRHLKAATSVAEAVGPVCRKYFRHEEAQ